MRGMSGIAVLTAALLGAGCRNSCQEVCSRMADYAAEDCGFTVGDDEISSCVDRMGSDLEKEDKQACRDLGSPDAIRTQWSCEDLAPYWSADAA